MKSVLYDKTIENLPNTEGTIGLREIVKKINNDDIKKVIIANNCPDKIKENIPEKIEVQIFNGNQKNLGTKLGKPFPVSIVGYE